jgi:DNA gyrase/topoisomerase IV subunit A
VYANSKLAKKRRNKFRRNLEKSNSEDTMSDDDMYLFLSNQGSCHYMARNDYRHAKTKSNPTGQRTDSLCKKLLKNLPDDFPQGFTFHWLRATFGHKYYQYLISLLEKGIIKDSEVISRVQSRMHHSKRETTENYLKLFLNINDRIKTQEMYENQLFAEYQDTWED